VWTTFRVPDDETKTGAFEGARAACGIGGLARYEKTDKRPPNRSWVYNRSWP